MSEKHGKVEATAMLLRRRFLFKDVDEAEERRSKKRIKENKKKKLLKARSAEAIVKLLRLIAPERSANFSDKDLISHDIFSISIAELKNFDETKLKTRIHLSRFKEMIKQEMFEDSVRATEIRDNLAKIAS